MVNEMTGSEASCLLFARPAQTKHMENPGTCKWWSLGLVGTCKRSTTSTTEYGYGYFLVDDCDSERALNVNQLIRVLFPNRAARPASNPGSFCFLLTAKARFSMSDGTVAIDYP